MSLSLLSGRIPPIATSKSLEIGLSVLLLGWVFRGAIEFAFWTLEFAWH